jgi:heavy metal sensor kinase
VSLTTRLSLFFLTALALVLLGFSSTLYLLARSYLHYQAKERLQLSMQTLATAMEDHDNGVEWEGEEHPLSLGQDDEPGQVRWIVRDQTGRVIDRSANLGAVALDSEEPGRFWRDDEPWLLTRRRQSTSATGPLGRKRYTSLELTAGLSLAPVGTMLQTLALTLVSLSALVWLAAASAGRWVCRRALAPVLRMKNAARSISAADLGQRLPSPGTRDELDDLCASFNDLLDRLEEAFARQRRFTGDASHQLRTPLTVMRGQLEVALRRARPAEEYRQALERVQGQTTNLQQIVEALLFLARADAEASLEKCDGIAVAMLLSDLTQRWSDHPRASDLHIAEVARDATVRGQAVLLGQLLDNLVDNAFRYSEQGSPVTLRVEQESSEVRMTIEDRGCGISSEDLPHIFEPFYRSPESRRRGRSGTGLGLAVVRRIVAIFGGTVTVESEVGRGSCFILRLPGAMMPQIEVTELPTSAV